RKTSRYLLVRRHTECACYIGRPCGRDVPRRYWGFAKMISQPADRPMFQPDQIETLKQNYTDKYVVVDANRPELARFRDFVGQVKTVNMSGRALVQFPEYYLNTGWYDIDLGFLKVVDKPEVMAQPKAEKKPAAPSKPAAEKSAAKPAQASAPAKGAGGK